MPELGRRSPCLAASSWRSMGCAFACGGHHRGPLSREARKMGPAVQRDRRMPPSSDLEMRCRRRLMRRPRSLVVPGPMSAQLRALRGRTPRQNSGRPPTPPDFGAHSLPTSLVDLTKVLYRVAPQHMSNPRHTGRCSGFDRAWVARLGAPSPPHGRRAWRRPTGRAPAAPSR